MTDARPYRQALRPDEAMAEIRKGAGTHYDPRMVEALERILLDEGGASTFL
jgi:HD-GYP domain-containing protein (c-di-GMP phosphodiesterase class II)